MIRGASPRTRRPAVLTALALTLALADPNPAAFAVYDDLPPYERARFTADYIRGFESWGSQPPPEAVRNDPPHVSEIELRDGSIGRVQQPHQQIVPFRKLDGRDTAVWIVTHDWRYRYDEFSDFVTQQEERREPIVLRSVEVARDAVVGKHMIVPGVWKVTGKRKYRTPDDFEVEVYVAEPFDWPRKK
jgi:hypothetical protein